MHDWGRSCHVQHAIRVPKCVSLRFISSRGWILRCIAYDAIKVGYGLFVGSVFLLYWGEPFENQHSFDTKSPHSPRFIPSRSSAPATPAANGPAGSSASTWRSPTPSLRPRWRTSRLVSRSGPGGSTTPRPCGGSRRSILSKLWFCFWFPN